MKHSEQINVSILIFNEAGLDQGAEKQCKNITRETTGEMEYNIDL